jgi:serine/threonine protein kinase
MLISENLDRFLIRRRLHVGAVATVYVAWDSYRAKEVVLKVLRPEHVHDPAFMSIFRRELKVSMLLEHAYIVPVRDVSLEGEKPYFSMPYYRAGSLRDHGCIGPHHAMRLGIQNGRTGTSALGHKLVTRAARWEFDR